ncbi:MAG: hypothetical protein II857_06590, partial [Selenomonadaceae bacterium]|nr:hypothetical protein [Selenomonadaceae bacterium]
GLSNSSAGRVSIFFFPSLFLSYIKKRIVFAFLHNPFYTTIKNEFALPTAGLVRKLDEATGHYSLYSHLHQGDQTVHVINPLQSGSRRTLPPTFFSSSLRQVFR